MATLSKFTTIAIAVLFTWVLLGTVGCQKDYGIELHYVKGTVTLDGKPLANAAVQFRPDASGTVVAPRGGVGYTDSDGQYVMLFRDTRGCPAGRFHVVISTYAEPTGGGQSGKSEQIPAKYRGTESVLAVTVSPDGHNVFDFRLESGG